MAWCGDVTYIPTDEGWLYLASVLDLASRHLLGYSMGAHHDAILVTGALEAAVATRGQRMPDPIFHTDRGAEYTSSACVQACQRLGLRHSMSRTGSCLDNAVAKRWFASLKAELVHRHHYRTRARPAPPSSAGSPGPTDPACTPPVATCHPSTGNTSTPPPARYHHPWPHNPGVHLPGGIPSCRYRGSPAPPSHSRGDRTMVIRQSGAKSAWDTAYRSAVVVESADIARPDGWDHSWSGQSRRCTPPHGPRSPRSPPAGTASPAQRHNADQCRDS